MHPNANSFAKFFTALALLLSFGFVGQTCSTESPTVVFDPDRPDDDDGDDGGGGGGHTLPDQGASSPEHGARILDGRPTILDAQPNNLTVDCHSVISIYFSESMKIKTIVSGSFELREKAFGTLVSTSQSTWLMGNRLLIIEPIFTLTPDTIYELTAFEGPVDLDGLAFDPTSTPVVLEFTTAAIADGVAPQILASYPLDSSSNQANDNQAVVVFSKQIDSTTISPAVSLFNQDTGFAADYDTTVGSESRHAGDRAFSFSHGSDDNDLDSIIRLDIAANIIADSSLSHMFLVDAYATTWTTMDLQRPAAVQFDPADFIPFDPAANLSNNMAFPLQVSMPAGALASDEVKLRVHQFDDSHVNDSKLVEDESLAGGGLVNFSVDLTADLLGIPTPVFDAESEMLIATYSERNGVRTNVTLRLDADDELEVVKHDLVPPTLVQFGPPFGSFLSQFRTTLPVVRSYGLATESIGHINVDVAATSDRFVPSVSDDSFFIANSFDPAPAIIDEGPEPFVIQLTDAAGNPALSSVSAEAHFSGFVGGTDLATAGGVMRVIAYDSVALFPIVGATVHIQDFAGGNEDFEISGSDGSVSFSSRSGPQTITIQRFGWQATTLIGADASEISLPLTSTAASAPISVSPQIENLNTGTCQISSNTLADSSGGVDEFMVQEYDLDLLFGDAVLSQQNQPGWFVSFHEVEDYPNTNPTGRYFRFVGIEERILSEPSTSSSAVVPVIEMSESSNTLLGATDYIYELSVTPGAGMSAPTASGTSISTVIPGLRGPVAVGVGSVDLLSGVPNGAAELEISLLADAQAEGADLLDININVYAADATGNSAAVAVSAAVGPNPPTVALTMPDIPTTSGGWGASYPFTAAFSDTLTGSAGLYQLTILDSSSAVGVWNIFVLNSAAVGAAVDLPSLLDAPGGPTANVPLSTDPGVQWSAYTSAWEMAPAFSEIGFFFDVVSRDRISWAQSSIASPVASF